MTKVDILKDDLIRINKALLDIHSEIKWIEGYGSKYHTLKEMRDLESRFKEEKVTAQGALDDEVRAMEAASEAVKAAYLVRKEAEMLKRKATIAKKQHAAEQEFARVWSSIKMRTES